jgi:DNA repair photolyase
VGRYESLAREPWDDGWGGIEEGPPRPATELVRDRTRGIIARNDSPDVPFDQSLNPYRGCEHGCIYCFARPTHAYLGYSPGLDFETRLLYKPDAPELLRRELARPAYRCATLALGANTDPDQPVERRLGVTRGLLEVLAEARHPVGIITKGALVERDLDLLGPMGREGLARVSVSVTTLDHDLARHMEPRATAPRRRLEAVRRLTDAGVPVTILMAPVIPAINDHEVEAVLEACREAGAVDAGYVLLRLPHEIKDLFGEWLEAHFPDRAARVLARVREAHGGRLYDAAWGRRMRGTGEYARLVAQRFALARRRLGFREQPPLRTDRFRRPADPEDRQLALL